MQIKTNKEIDTYEIWCKHPHFVLYWVALKYKYGNMEDWADEMDKHEFPDKESPLVLAAKLYRKYGTKNNGDGPNHS